MIDLAEDVSQPEDTMMPRHKDKKYYPTLHISKVVPELNEKKIGNTCKIEVLAKIVSLSETGVTLEIQKMEYKGDGKV